MTLVEVPLRLFEGTLQTPAILKADADAPFVESAWRALGSTDPAILSHPLYLRVPAHNAPENSVSHLAIPANCAVRTILEVAGDGEIELSHGGWGGDPFWSESLLSVLEVLGLGLTIKDLAKIVRTQVTSLSQLRYGRHARLAATWSNEGRPTHVAMELRQLVKEQNPWLRSHFDFVFRLDNSEAVDLLRACGYRFTRYVDRDALWTDETEDHGKSYSIH